MANSEDLGFIGSLVTAADLSAKQFTFVKMTSSGVNTAGVGDSAIGVLWNVPVAAVGAATTIAYRGVPKVTVGTGPIASGALVKPDANGKAVTASAADAVAGFACGISVSKTSRATGEYVRILMLPNFLSAYAGTETLNADGAISVTKMTSFLDSSGGVRAWTLADGLFDGQRKVMLMLVAGNNGVVTPVSGHFKNPAAAVSTATFNAAADMLDLVWDNAATAWRTVNSVSITFA